MSIHIFTADTQRATRFLDTNGSRPRWVKFAAQKLLYCGKCRKRRWASRLVVQVYGDGWRFYCAKGRGCAK